jgi:transcriptional regulator with XRE-family HTH domain
MALAKPKGMDEVSFLERSEGVREWFTPLNPYERKGPLFKLEDANYRIEDGELTDQLEPLYALAVSAKRYALFNIDERGRPVLRKVSAHGLGHLRPPYEEGQAPSSVPKPAVLLSDLEAERWQHDFWYRIVEATLGDTPEQVRLDDLPGFERPAVSRYAATTPKLLRWFDRYNEGKSYRERVKPFGFLLAYQAGPPPFAGDHLPRPVSAYDGDLDRVAEGCFDRETGEPVPRDQLKSYHEALAQYHLHPESKFHNGDYTDRGFTRRRHVRATVTEYIGKEANRWEEQLHLGLDLEAQTEYGLSSAGRRRALEAARGAAETHGQRQLAAAAGISLSELSAVLLGKRQPSKTTLTKLYRALPRIERDAREQIDDAQDVLDTVREQSQRTSIRQLAKWADLDASNIAHVLSGRREPSRKMIARLRALIAQG